MGVATSVLMGAVAMASFVTALFFLRFWHQTQDRLFLYFSIAFGVDAATRFVLALSRFSDETEPLFYVGRLITFGLIILAVFEKNRPNRRT